MRKNKAIKLTEGTLKILKEFKITARKSTYEEIILFLLNDKKKEIESVVEFEIQKKILVKKIHVLFLKWNMKN